LRKARLAAIHPVCNEPGVGAEWTERQQIKGQKEKEEKQGKGCR
jgi:hypothetical protein